MKNRHAIVAAAAAAAMALSACSTVDGRHRDQSSPPSNPYPLCTLIDAAGNRSPSYQGRAITPHAVATVHIGVECSFDSAELWASHLHNDPAFSKVTVVAEACTAGWCASSSPLPVRSAQ